VLGMDWTERGQRAARVGATWVVVVSVVVGGGVLGRGGERGFKGERYFYIPGETVDR
jgi:hypothetical protein